MAERLSPGKAHDRCRRKLSVLSNVCANVRTANAAVGFIDAVREDLATLPG